MAPDWPAADVAPLIPLIDDPGRTISAGGHLSSCPRRRPRAILELRLQRLTGLERDKIAEELAERGKARSTAISRSWAPATSCSRILRDELVEIKEQFATPRRTEILDGEFEEDVEDLIQREDMVVTVTHGGYIKRVPLSAYRAQRRGGKGRSGMATREEDFVSSLFVANTHTPVLFFSQPRHGLQAEGLPPAAGRIRRRAARRWSTCCRSSEGETITTVHAAAGGRGELVEARHDVRDRAAATCAATSSAISST